MGVGEVKKGCKGQGTWRNSYQAGISFSGFVTKQKAQKEPLHIHLLHR